MRTNKQQARERARENEAQASKKWKSPPPKEEDGKSNRGGTMESPKRKQQNLKNKIKIEVEEGQHGKA
jgi:hypothetical protein